MLAIIKTGGKQYLIAPGDKIKIEKLDTPEGKEVFFNEVLMISDDKDDVKLGTPLIKGAKVKAKILEHGKAKKVIVFKYKSKKRYQRKKGHRQPYTKVEILDILSSVKKSVS